MYTGVRRTYGHDNQRRRIRTRQRSVRFNLQKAGTHYADDLIVDLLFRVKENKKYIFDATVNFRWGVSAHVSADDYEFAAGLNKLMDILDQKVKKEKDKIQQKN